MKSNVNNRKGLVRLSLLSLGACVLVAGAMGMAAYSRAQQQTERNEQDVVMLDRLIEARRANLLLQCLTRGKDAKARQMLTLTLTDNLQQAKVLTSNASPAVATEALCAITILERDQKAHPELYAALQSTGQTPQTTIEIAKREARH